MSKKLMPKIAIVPFKREKSGHITVVAHLSGQPVRLVVDTGAGGTCIHSALLEEYGLKLTGKARKGGGVGSSAMTMATVAVHDLALEDVDLSSFKLTALDLTHVVAGLAKAKVEAIVGVLGADVLHRRNAVIDYARSVMLLSH